MKNRQKLRPKTNRGSVEKRINDEVPDEKYYLSRHNQTVKKSTKAANTGAFRNAPGQSELGNKAGAGITAPQNRQKALNTGKGLALKKLVPNYDFKQDMGDYRESGAASAQDDHLKDVSVGMETVLSTREFLYYTYFNRIKDKLRQRWGPKVREKVTNMVKRGRHIASTQTRITKVIIVLNAQGTLVNVKVIGESGVIDLDDAAVEAFRSAAPFPNPPRGMVGKDGHVKITWDFVLEA
ncbi:MAG: energy transducer TonB [Bdellovibrionales bacterium]